MFAYNQALDDLKPVADKPAPRPFIPPSTEENRGEDPICALRLHTCRLHYALEKTPSAQTLLSPKITLQRYAENLVIWAAAWQTIEHVLYESPFAKKVPQLLPRPRACLADADLAYLYSQSGVRHDDKSSRHSAVEVLSFEPVNLSSFIGVCYVIVGASLGSVIIAKHLDATLDVKEGNGASFFSAGCGEQLSFTQWIRSANEILSVEKDISAACRGAIATFEFLLTAFSTSTFDAIDDVMDIDDPKPADTRTG